MLGRFADFSAASSGAGRKLATRSVVQLMRDFIMGNAVGVRVSVQQPLAVEEAVD